MVASPARRRLALALAALLPLGLASCGSPEAGPRAAAPSPSFTGSTVRVDYAPGLSEQLYLPTRKGRAPLVVMVPGGSWQTSDPTGLGPLAAHLASAGIIASPARVRAAEDGVVYPAPVQDVLCALAAAVARARAGGYRPGPVVVLGHSSGAHLAALAVLGSAEYPAACTAPAVPPDALVGLSGPYDISHLPDVASALLGSMPEEDPAAWTAANPVRRAASRPQVPVLLLHGDADDVVPVGFTTQLGAALKDGGHPVVVQVVPGADHDSIYSAQVAGSRIAQWLRTVPKG